MFYHKVPKEKNTTCGAACLFYVLEQLDCLTNYSEQQFFWIFELATFMKKLGCPHRLSYHESKLVSDFCAARLPDECTGKTSIIEYLQTGETIYNNAITLKNIADLFKSYTYIIALVASSILNEDETLSGGHYVVIEKIDTSFALVFNPRLNISIIQWVENARLLNAISEQGGWILSVSR